MPPRPPGWRRTTRPRTARVEAHHTASDARVEAHHTASGVALTGSAAAESAGREIVQGPHGGALVPLGDGVAVLEFTFDVTTGMFSMYVWDAALESPVFIRQNLVFLKVPLGGGQDGGVMLAPVENDMTGDTKGHASEFVGGLRRLIGREEFDVFVEWVIVDDQSTRVIPFPMPEGNGLGPGLREVAQAAAPEGE